MEEDPLVYIVRGLPHPFDKSIVEALSKHLSGNTTLASLLKKLEKVAQVMNTMPEYDVSDFNSQVLRNSIDLLRRGDKAVWGQLLHALDDKHSPHWRELKDLSPYKDVYLMFLDASFGPAGLEADMDDGLAAELLRRADAHDCPGNMYMVVLTPEILEQLVFVPAIDNLPATA